MATTGSCWKGRLLDGMDLGNQPLDAADQVELVISELQALSTTLVGMVASSDYSIDPTAVNAVAVPEINWDTVSITGAVAYFNYVLSQTLGLPTHYDIPYNPPPDLTLPSDIGPYDDTLRRATAASIISDLGNGGYGIQTETERMVFEAARDKANVDLSKAMATAAGRYSGSGLARPPGALYALAGGVIGDYQASLSEANDKLVADANEKFAKAKGDTYASAVALARVTFDEFAMLVKMAIMVFKANMERFYQEIKGQSMMASAEYDGYASGIQAYSADMDATAKSYQALAGMQEFGFKRYDSELSAAIEEAKATLTALLSEMKLYISEGDAKVKAYASVGSAALSGIDVNARIAASVSGEISASSSTSKSDSSDISASNTLQSQVRISSEADGSIDDPWQQLP